MIKSIKGLIRRMESTKLCASPNSNVSLRFIFNLMIELPLVFGVF